MSRAVNLKGQRIGQSEDVDDAAAEMKARGEGDDVADIYDGRFSNPTFDNSLCEGKMDKVIAFLC